MIVPSHPKLTSPEVAVSRGDEVTEFWALPTGSSVSGMKLLLFKAQLRMLSRPAPVAVGVENEVKPDWVVERSDPEKGSRPGLSPVL